MRFNRASNVPSRLPARSNIFQVAFGPRCISISWLIKCRPFVKTCCPCELKGASFTLLPKPKCDARSAACPLESLAATRSASPNAPPTTPASARPLEAASLAVGFNPAAVAMLLLFRKRSATSVTASSVFRYKSAKLATNRLATSRTGSLQGSSFSHPVNPNGSWRLRPL